MSTKLEAEQQTGWSRTLLWCGLLVGAALTIFFTSQLVARPRETTEGSPANSATNQNESLEAVGTKLAASRNSETKNAAAVTSADSPENEVADEAKKMTERERRLKSLAIAVEKEERPAIPTFEGTPAKKSNGSITFDDIKFEMEKTERFNRDMLTKSITDLVKQRIKIKGYIRPSNRQRGLTKFIFVRDDKECCFGPGAALYDCILVTLSEGEKSDFTVRPITIEGEFYLKEYVSPDGQIWAVYRMKDAYVK